MKSKTKHSRGGARPGAGRKPLGRVKALVSFAPETIKELKDRARAKKVPLGNIIDELVSPERRAQ